MELSAVLAAAGVAADFAAVLAPDWEQSVATLPARIEALDPAVFTADRIYVGLAPELDADLSAVARAIAAQPALRLLFWHCLHSIYDREGGVNSAAWPDFEAQLEGRGGLFYLLAALAMVPRMRRVHTARGIPEAITRDSAQQVRCFCDEMYRRGQGGRPGVFRSQVYWMRRYTDGHLYRLGRMEYMLRPANGYVEVWRQRASGRVQALASGGLWVDAEGIFVSAEEAASAGDRVWQTTFVRQLDAVRGAPVAPTGYVARREVSLPLVEWERVFGPGDPIMEMHIPAGGGMPPEACADSLRRGFAFFAQYFPETPVRATACISWICNNQLFKILRPESNLVKFLDEVYLFPVVSGPRSGLFFLFFLDRDFDLAGAPEDTSVQRAVKQFLLAGHRWRSGGMFFLKDDLEKFGAQPYRSVDVQ